jgi:hypothetical protein
VKQATADNTEALPDEHGTVEYCTQDQEPSTWKGGTNEQLAVRHCAIAHVKEVQFLPHPHQACIHPEQEELVKVSCKESPLHPFIENWRKCLSL